MGVEHKVLRGALKGALNLLYPPQCPGCGDPVATASSNGGDLCPQCWRDMHFITGCFCGRCGAPLPDDGTGLRDESLLCDDCLRVDRPWRQGRAAFVYKGTGRKLVLALKHGDRPDLGPPLANWLAQVSRPLIRKGMIVAPVPLHMRRLLKRRYNQAGLISRGLAISHGAQHLPNLLRRTRHTPPQDRRSASDRFANLQDAVAVNPRLRELLQGRAVLLVDDVMASGATLSACAKALLDAGSGPISVAVLARAVKDD
ncbi:ComF family protein [Paracoccus seriniphilus]|uniref:ComF family protein n=1 Tax=Paracoccus seriniphilus TaxID=184748 RepID=A0A239PRZ9_9RHOB|nr:ComF family protein [Paracoccus seriniphilus]WCR14370.1 ComF family protein [Paracoccus seriniphilus]SNT72918.1 comF family protein [Paracoccus seriniphilus]